MENAPPLADERNLRCDWPWSGDCAAIGLGGDGDGESDSSREPVSAAARLLSLSPLSSGPLETYLAPYLNLPL
ncbi:hypothetical protein scyTo_0008653 [Scyliorhinus torazame]|uniref:Uncharacterized protein n=1 Tax=Scyliorhinus torazame TaxID=75743 RepID=A0A401PC63_SCYTO|nr:hypothetical protein [Scyliorhinus torazame]